MNDIKVECGEEIHKAFENIRKEVIDDFKKQFMGLYQKELLPWQLEFFNKTINSIREKEEEIARLRKSAEEFKQIGLRCDWIDLENRIVSHGRFSRAIPITIGIINTPSPSFRILKQCRQSGKSEMIFDEFIDSINSMPEVIISSSDGFNFYSFRECPLPEFPSPPIPNFKSVEELKRMKEEPKYPRNMLKGRKGRY